MGLTYERGLQRVRVAPARCAQCHTRFVSCWALPHKTEDSPRLVCDPTHSSWFVFRMRLREESFAALHADYLRFMTAAFLHLRASFSGLALTAASMFPTGVLGANDCNRALIHPSLKHPEPGSMQSWRMLLSNPAPAKGKKWPHTAFRSMDGPHLLSTTFIVRSHTQSESLQAH